VIDSLQILHTDGRRLLNRQAAEPKGHIVAMITVTPLKFVNLQGIDTDQSDRKSLCIQSGQ
jgi:hypothetical protein